MWPFRRNNPVVPSPWDLHKRPKLRDIYTALRLLRSHIAGIHSILSTVNTVQLGHDAQLRHVAGVLEKIERQVRPAIPGHLAPDDQGRPPTDPDHGLPASSSSSPDAGGAS